MHVTIDIPAWVKDNRPRGAVEAAALRRTLTQQSDVAPYAYQKLGRDWFVTGYASILWLQSAEARGRSLPSHVGSRLTPYRALTIARG
jgi:hypothetical protein